jgi:DNA polymerase
MTICIDLETYSTADLRKTGARKYARDPSTGVICLAYKLNGSEHVWEPGDEIPAEFYTEDFSAWNAMFEWLIWNNILAPRHGFPPLPIERIDCTMIRGAYYGLPMSLDKAAIAIRAPMTKDKTGHALMLRMCRPRGYDDDGSPRWWHLEEDGKRAQLIEYCKQDVRTEHAIGEMLPPLPAAIKSLWHTDVEMNERGWRIDRDLIAAMERKASEAKEDLNAAMGGATGGFVTRTTQREKLLEWLNNKGIVIPDDSLNKAALIEILEEGDLPPEIEHVLRIRQEASKSSVAKLAAFTSAAEEDDRVRGMFQFWGASRTGRWSGRLVQLQNLPRPLKGFSPDDYIEGGLEDPQGYPTMSALSSCLRGVLVPAKDHVLIASDFAAIEARVVAWLAGQHDVLDVFAKGEDVYTWTARQSGSNNRDFGKVQVLACGFGMGPGKFQSQAAGYGVFLTAEAADRTVTGWRGRNRRICEFWWDLDKGVRTVLRAKEQIVVEVGPIKIAMGGGKLRGVLIIKLPSGRHLFYRDIHLAEKGEDGHPPAIFYSGLNLAKQWTKVKTYGGKLCENIVQATAADLMAHAFMEVTAEGIPVVGLVHDELIAEVRGGLVMGALAHIQKAMSVPPAWAEGLPLACSATVRARYGK